MKNTDERGVKECLQKVVEARLKIKIMGEDMQVVSNNGGGLGQQQRYVAYFVEASALLLGNSIASGAGKAAEGPLAKVNKHKDETKYDIRNGFRFLLTDPDVVLAAEKEHIPEEK